MVRVERPKICRQPKILVYFGIIFVIFDHFKAYFQPKSSILDFCDTECVKNVENIPEFLTGIIDFQKFWYIFDIFDIPVHFGISVRFLTFFCESRKHKKDDLVSNDFQQSKIDDFQLLTFAKYRKILPNA